jgi:flagellum-specific peptidoglycan hydrolase FlgJ
MVKLDFRKSSNPNPSLADWANLLTSAPTLADVATPSPGTNRYETAKPITNAKVVTISK